MESRAWGATKNRTNLYALRMHKGDLFLMGITVGLIAAGLYVRLFVTIPSIAKLLAHTFRP
jgi:energy-coupling factor transporter transmembrane protein EcfT